MNKTQLLSLVLALCSLTACQDHKTEKNQNVIGIKGDPIAFVANTKNNSSHQFDPEFFSDLGTLELKINGFEEKYVQESYEEAVEKQKPENLNISKKLDFTVERTAEGHIRASSTELSLTIEYRRKNSGYRLYSISNGKETLFEGENLDKEFKVIHNSSSRDGLAISTLIYVGKVGERSLYNFVIMNSHKSSSVVEKISEKFLYLAGAGVKVKWQDSNVSLDVCNAPHVNYSIMVSDSARLWNEASNNILKLSASAKVHCPPFSDLNTKTYQFIDGFVEMPDLSMGQLGTTMVVQNDNEQRYIDGDVVILKKEYEDSIAHALGQPMKLEDPTLLNHSEFQSNVKATAIHELGHFLGLHHQFDPNTKSIMSYDDIRSIQQYDKDAIQNLYEVKKQTPRKAAPKKKY